MYSSVRQRLLGQRALALLADERLVDVGDDSAAGDGRLDQGVQLLVPADGELQMPRGDPLHLEVLGGVAGELEYLGGEVLEDGGAVDGGGGSHTARREGAALQVTVDPEETTLSENKTKPLSQDAPKSEPIKYYHPP